MAKKIPTVQALLQESRELRARLEESDSTLRAIREGEVDALMVDGPDGHRIYTLQGADAESNQFRGAILAQIGEAVLAVDPDQRVTYLNSAAERLYGLTPGEALGRRLTELYELGPDARGHDRDLTLPRHDGAPWRIEQVHRTRDGREMPVELSDTPLLDSAGQPAGRLSVIKDITDRKGVEQALRASEERFRALAGQLEHVVKERTEELVQSQDRLRALAKELNLTEHRERKRLADELHDYLAQLLVVCRLNLAQMKRIGLSPKAAEKLRETEEVLSKALHYSRTLMAELSPPILHQYGLPAGLLWLGEQMAHRGLTVRVDAGGIGDVKIPDDSAVLLFQSVRELLLNALKYAECSEVVVRLEQADGRLRIEIRDDGVGFDVVAADLYGPTAMSSKFGLFSIQERIRSLGGWFELQSSCGKGTTAALVMPLKTADSSELKVLSAELSDQGRNSEPSTPNSKLPQQDAKIRVLLVDDHAMVRQGLRTVLGASHDLEVVGEACNGEEAVAFFERMQPSVVVMDINMPKMNGIDATAAIVSRYPGTVVIGLSVQAGGANEEAMKKAGASMLLTKEAAVDELYRVIRETLVAKRLGGLGDGLSNLGQ